MELGTVREIPRQKWNAAPGLPQVYPHIQLSNFLYYMQIRHAWLLTTGPNTKGERASLNTNCKIDLMSSDEIQ